MKSSPSIALLAAALVKAHAQFQPIHKDAKNPFFNSKFASLDNIMVEVRPILAALGLSLVQGVNAPETVEGHLMVINVTTTLLHESGEWVSVDVVVPVAQAPVEKGKPEKAPNAQTAGSAITYGRRYGVSALLALSTDEDDDGNAASRPAARTARPSKPESGDTFDSLRIPFGKPGVDGKGGKGTPNDQLSTDHLTKALAWAREKDKFHAWQLQAEAELEERRLRATKPPTDITKPVPDDGLPF